MILARYARPRSAKRVFAKMRRASTSEKCLRERRPGHQGARSAAARGHHKLNAAQSTVEDGLRRYQAASAALAFSAIAWNAAGSLTARSDSTLRSTVIPDLAMPSINRL